MSSYHSKESDVQQPAWQGWGLLGCGTEEWLEFPAHPISCVEGGKAVFLVDAP